jgi:hypothetical protein
MDVTLDDTLDLLHKWGLVVKDTGSDNSSSSSSSSSSPPRYQLRPLPEAVRRLKAQSLLQRVMQIQDDTAPDDADTPSSSGAGSSSSSSSPDLPVSGASESRASQAHSGRAVKQPASVTPAVAAGGGYQQHQHRAAGAAVAASPKRVLLHGGAGSTRRMRVLAPRAVRATGGRSCMCSAASSRLLV